MTWHFERASALVLTCALATGCPGTKDSGDSAPTTSPGTPVGTPTTTTTTTTTTPCGGGFAVTVDWTDDGLDPEDLDNDGTNETGCDGDSVDIAICDPLGVTAWRLGMAEDGAQGWTGEDCFSGYTGTNVCHPIGVNHTLTEVCTIGEVVAGSTTLLDAKKDPYLTYYLEDTTNGSCFVFGADVAYYATLGCTEML